MTTILFLGDKHDSLLKRLFSYVEKNKLGDIVWLESRDIISDLEIDDFISSDGEVRIKWTVNGRKITPSQTLGVVNRLHYLSDDLFSDFIRTDREYAKAEFNAYLVFALSQFKNILNPAWGSSLSGFCQSLIYQWLLVSSLGLPIKIPSFAFGLPSELRSYDLTYNTVISNNIYNTRYWNTDRLKEIEPQVPLLLYERPSGEPYVFTILDDNIWCDRLVLNPKENELWSTLVALSKKMFEHFNLRMVTILAFINHEDRALTFGSIEPNVDLSFVHPDYQEEFVKELAKKLVSPPMS